VNPRCCSRYKSAGLLGGSQKAQVLGRRSSKVALAGKIFGALRHACSSEGILFLSFLVALSFIRRMSLLA
jgi:hypothetical protein